MGKTTRKCIKFKYIRAIIWKVKTNECKNSQYKKYIDRYIETLNVEYLNFLQLHMGLGGIGRVFGGVEVQGNRFIFYLASCDAMRLENHE